jgi:hypothetical protein
MEGGRGGLLRPQHVALHTLGLPGDPRLLAASASAFSVSRRSD